MLNVRPPSVDFTYTIPSPELATKANWRQKTYTSPFGETAISVPKAFGMFFEMMIGLENVWPSSVERANRILLSWPGWGLPAPVSRFQAA